MYSAPVLLRSYPCGNSEKKAMDLVIQAFDVVVTTSVFWSAHFMMSKYHFFQRCIYSWLMCTWGVASLAFFSRRDSDLATSISDRTLCIVTIPDAVLQRCGKYWKPPKADVYAVNTSACCVQLKTNSIIRLAAFVDIVWCKIKSVHSQTVSPARTTIRIIDECVGHIPSNYCLCRTL